MQISWLKSEQYKRFRAHPVVRVLIESVDRSGQADIMQAAASISYYTLFAIIPFLLIAVTISSMLAESSQVQSQITAFFLAMIPKMSQQLIQTNLERIMDLRGTVRFVSLIFFLWGATGTFSSIIVNLDRAGDLKVRSFNFKSHIKGVIIMTSLAALLPIFFLAKGLIQLVLELDLPFSSLAFVDDINPYLYLLLPYLVLFLVLSALYRWGPHHATSWTSATMSSLIITLIMKWTSAGFTWYLARGLSRYNVLYGSLGAVLVLLFWLFLIMTILLFGAHLGAAIERVRNGENEEAEALEEALESTDPA